jgi:hypothetical protein
MRLQAAKWFPFEVEAQGTTVQIIYKETERSGRAGLNMDSRRFKTDGQVQSFSEPLHQSPVAIQSSQEAAVLILSAPSGR